jgi:hypothetical protein
MPKCAFCGKEVHNNKNYVRIANEDIPCCSPECVWYYLRKRFYSDNRVYGAKIEE